MMRHLLAVYLSAVMLSAISGCATTPASKFYILSPVSTDTAAQPANLATAVGVGPVEIPNYLDRPQIAVRSGANEILYSETHRWAEELKENMTNILAQNLSLQVPTDEITVFPWGRYTTIDYQLVVEVSRFEADASGDVVLSANWRLLQEENREVIAQGKPSFTEPAGGTGYAGIVAALSRALASLSREIAGAIRVAASH